MAIDCALLDAVERGFSVWRTKPHNKRWWKLIDGTPIPNDLAVCIAEEVTEASANIPPTQDAYDAACQALNHWRAEAKRLAKLAGVEPRQMDHL